MAENTLTATIKRMERDLADTRAWYRRDGPLQKHVDRLERLRGELAQALAKAQERAA